MIRKIKTEWEVLSLDETGEITLSENVTEHHHNLARGDFRKDYRNVYIGNVKLKKKQQGHYTPASEESITYQ